MQKSLWHQNFNYSCSLSQAHKSNISLLAVLMGPELFHAAIKTYIFIKSQGTRRHKELILQPWGLDPYLHWRRRRAGCLSLCIPNCKCKGKGFYYIGNNLRDWPRQLHPISVSTPLAESSHKEGRSGCEFLSQNRQSRDLVSGILKRTGIWVCSREECLAVFCEKMQGRRGEGWLQDLLPWEKEKICQWNRCQALQSSNCKWRSICVGPVPWHLPKLTGGNFCI